ncbi:MAG: hypothetical protein EOM20_06910 [Spartobacteria bacterium]|nr:hypothetical protein [Spartobacteria bacterium]
MTTPLHIGATQPMRDQWGGLLIGSESMPGDVIQVLWASSNGVAYPPDVDGAPDPRNPMVHDGLTGVGALTLPSLGHAGLFGMSLNRDRPVTGSQIFVRVFNAPALKNASFYGDSYIFTVNGNTVFDVGLVATTNAMDPLDPDNDGLNNSWERVYMSDPNNADTDGDGMTDGDESLAGTDMLDSNSVFTVATMLRAEGRNVRIGWDSVPGGAYRVQFTTNDLNQDPVFVNVSAVVTAQTYETSAVITNGLLLGRGHFRIGCLYDQSE